MLDRDIHLKTRRKKITMAYLWTLFNTLFEGVTNNTP